MYRMRLDWTYTTTANANTALASINSVLTAEGRPEQATRTGNTVGVVLTEIATQADAEALRAALQPAWSSAARSYGKASCVRTDP